MKHCLALCDVSNLPFFFSIIQADNVCNHSCVTPDIAAASNQTHWVAFQHSTISLKVQCALCFMNIGQIFWIAKNVSCGLMIIKEQFVP